MILTSEQYRLMQKRSMTVEEMGRAGGKLAKFSKVPEYRPYALIGQDSRHPAIPSSITVRKVMGRQYFLNFSAVFFAPPSEIVHSFLQQMALVPHLKTARNTPAIVVLAEV